MATILALLLLIGPLLPEGGAQRDKRPNSEKPATVLVGCVHRSELKLTKPHPSGPYSDAVRLRGPKKIMKALREHDGHEEELTGTLTEPAGKMGGGKSKSIGKRTKITVGAHEDRAPDMPEEPQLTVLSFRHVNSACPR